LLIKYKAGRILHVDNAIGRDLIARGEAVEVVPPKKTIPQTTWEVRQSPIPEHGPYLAAHCETCGLNCCCAGPNATKTAKFLHCGVVESVPDYVAKNYDKQHKAWQAGKEARPSSVSLAQREIEVQRLTRLQKARTHV